MRARLSFIGWNYTQLAVRLNHYGVHPPTVSKWARGVRWPSALLERKMARLLDVSVSYFAGSDEPTTRPRPNVRLVTEAFKSVKVPASLVEWLESKHAICGARGERIFRGPTLRREGGLEDMAAVAERVRDHWQLGADPIADMRLCLARRNILVWSVPDHVPMPRGVVSVCGRVAGFGFIGVRRSVEADPGVWRFTVASELARVLFSGTKGEGPSTVGVRRFARAFLLPRTPIDTCLLRFPRLRANPDFLVKTIDLLSGGWGIPWREAWARLRDIWKWRRGPLDVAKKREPAGDLAAPVRSGLEMWAAWYTAGAEQAGVLSQREAEEMRRRIADDALYPWSIGLEQWPVLRRPTGP